MDDFLMQQYPAGLLSTLGINPEDLRRQQQQAGLLSAGLQLLAGSGYSPVRQTTGQLVGQAGMAGLQGMQQAGQSAVERAIQGLQVSDITRKQQEASALRSAMQQPTMQAQIQQLQQLGRYDLIKNLAESQQALRRAGLGTPTAGAEELPSPFAPYLAAQSPNVRELAQTYDRGFKSGRIDEDMADKRLADLARMEESFVGRVESARDREQARRESAADRRSAREEKLLQGTEGQNLSAGFASRMVSSGAIVDELENLQITGSAQVLPTKTTSSAAGVPIFGGFLQRQVMNSEQQQYKQAAENWIRANLRKESGAAIPSDEMALEYENYFPVVGDKPEAIAQKREARKITEAAMIRNAGPVYKPVDIGAIPSILSIRQKYKLER
jgi:hypothetical protein